MPLGHRIVIVGGDLAALELAEFLAERGRHVGLLEAGETIAPEVGLKRRDEHMLRLDRARVAVNTGVRIERIERAGVVWRHEDGAESLIPADSVILAGGVEPDTTLYDEMKHLVDDVRAVGDCTGLGLIRKAVLEGAEAAAAL
jgi:2,4-dienoyl-CoA reductase (NADPH2)